MLTSKAFTLSTLSTNLALQINSWLVSCENSPDRLSLLPMFKDNSLARFVAMEWWKELAGRSDVAGGVLEINVLRGDRWGKAPYFRGNILFQVTSKSYRHDGFVVWGRGL